MVNVVLAGGGTAGHTSPLIATAMALQERGARSRVLVRQGDSRDELSRKRGCNLT